MALDIDSAPELRRIFDDKAFRGHATMAMGVILDGAASTGRPDFVIALLVRIYNEYAKLRAMEPGVERARFVHWCIDDYLARAPEDVKADVRMVNCEKGCAGCCHINVGITPDEAKLLAARMRSDVVVDLEHLRTQAALPDDEGAWMLVPQGVRRCVFLDAENACSVYNDRPSACRKYFAQAKPEECSVPGGKVHVLSLHDLEITASAALNLGTPGPLAKMLLKEISQ